MQGAGEGDGNDMPDTHPGTFTLDSDSAANPPHVRNPTHEMRKIRTSVIKRTATGACTRSTHHVTIRILAMQRELVTNAVATPEITDNLLSVHGSVTFEQDISIIMDTKSD